MIADDTKRNDPWAEPFIRFHCSLKLMDFHWFLEWDNRDRILRVAGSIVFKLIKQEHAIDFIGEYGKIPLNKLY